MSNESASRARRPGWLVALRVVSIAVACLAAVGAIYVRDVMKPRGTPPPPLPSPNGYDDLIRASAMIGGNPPNLGGFKEAKLDDLRAWVAANAEALRVAREGLARPSRVPVVYERDLKAEMDHMSGCRGLGRLLAAEAEVAIRDGRPVDAARSFLDELRLGRATGRGGLMVDVLAGVAIETQALDGLAHLRERLPADEVREAIATLLRADSDREPWAEVRDAEDYWVERTVPYMIRLSLRVSGAGESLRAPADRAAIAASRRVRTTLRRELVALAERLYSLDKKSDPASPADLVPAYLPAIPENPATGRPITDVE